MKGIKVLMGNNICSYEFGCCFEKDKKATCDYVACESCGIVNCNPEKFHPGQKVLCDTCKPYRYVSFKFL